MSEMYRDAFQTLVDRAPDPPTWEELSAGTFPRRRGRGPLIAVGAAAAVIVTIGAVAWLLPGGGGLTPAAGEVDHARVAFQEQVTLICEGGSISDNGGFDEATIDIYGPGPDDRWRADVTFPDGSVQSYLYEGGPASPSRAWVSPGLATPGVATRFRDVGCTYPTPEGSATWSLSGAPIMELRIPSEFLTTEQNIGERSGDLLEDFESALGLIGSRPDTWRGVPVTVYVRDRGYVDDVGRRVTASTEWWVDVAARRVERIVDVGDHEGLGSWRSELAVVARSRPAPGPELFDPEGMTLVWDVAEVEPSAAPTTTSIPPLSEPLMADAVPVGPAELPATALEDVADLRDGDRLFRLSVGDRALFVRLRPGVRPLLFGTSCDLLTSVALPAGWDGICTERVVDGMVRSGVFSYEDAAGR